MVLNQAFCSALLATDLLTTGKVAAKSYDTLYPPRLTRNLLCCHLHHSTSVSGLGISPDQPEASCTECVSSCR